jgi:hypothetical protein
MGRIFIAAAAAGCAASLCACATITEGRHQTITVYSVPPGASCVLKRKGVEIGSIASTPGTVSVDKTKHDVTILCDKPGYQRATFLDHSGVEAMTVGNAIAGGVIGWAIDSSTGSDNRYASPVTITLTPEATAAPANNSASAAAPTSATAPASAGAPAPTTQPSAQPASAPSHSP